MRVFRPMKMTAAGSENGTKLVTRLNPLGIDTMPVTLPRMELLFSDVVVHDGMITLLDSNYGNIVQFSTSGTSSLQVSNMGSLGSQVGLFQKPTSIEEVGGKIYVLDSEKNSITEFIRTEYGDDMREALRLYTAGLYQESAEYWEKVIQKNSTYVMGYGGLGSVYYQTRDYEKAMYYFKLGNDKQGYSDAFKEHSLAIMREAFPYVAAGLIVVIAAAVVIPKTVRRRKEEPDD